MAMKSWTNLRWLPACISYRIRWTFQAKLGKRDNINQLLNRVPESLRSMGLVHLPTSSIKINYLLNVFSCKYTSPMDPLAFVFRPPRWTCFAGVVQNAGMCLWFSTGSVAFLWHHFGTDSSPSDTVCDVLRFGGWVATLGSIGGWKNNHATTRRLLHFRLVFCVRNRCHAIGSGF